VPKEISSQVSKARLEKKLDQEALAKKISENIKVVKDLEAGEGVYNAKVVEKIEKVLNIKFDRSWKK
jgi:ribosome-binding protein aMBF1 (putative translation factor)